MEFYKFKYRTLFINLNKCNSLEKMNIIENTKFLSFKASSVNNNKYYKIIKLFYINYYHLKLKKFLSEKHRKNRYNYFKRNKLDTKIKPLVNLLKISSKFKYVSKRFFTYCRIYFKYTGSNIFGTITDNKGAVCFRYSSGFFKGLRTRKEKTTVFVAQQLGQLICLRMYKSNAKSVYFIPLINHRKARVLIRFMSFGFRFIRFFKIKYIFIKRKVMRNGVRLKKVPRK